jgi:raffinose/stachyose/melibiose transport system substrate-binding protein
MKGKKDILLITFVLAIAMSFFVFPSFAASKSKESVNIQFWHKDIGFKQQLYQKYVKEFEKQNPNIKVKITQMRNENYKSKLPIAFSGNTAPDVFFSWGGGWLHEFVKSGNVLNITDKINTSPFLKSALTNSTFNNKLYGVPLGMDMDFIFYNQAIFKKYKLSPPKTWNQLIKTCQVLKKNGIVPFTLANQPKWPGSFFFMYLVDRIGGPETFNNALSRNNGAFNDPAFIKAGEEIQKLVKLNAFNPGFNGLMYDSGPGRQLFYSEKTAMMLLSSTFMNLMRTEAPGFEKKLGIFPFPAYEGGKGNPSNMVGIAAPVWSVYSRTKHPNECIKLIQFLTCKKIAQEYADGSGSISARKDVKSNDPFAHKVEKLTKKAKHVQMVYDQTLPPELAQSHLSTTQEIFGLTMSPKAAADTVENKAKSVLGK